MYLQNRQILLLSLIFSLFALTTAGRGMAAHAGPPVDNILYAELLKEYVKDGVVDYQGFKKQLESDRDSLEIKHLDYDWSLNGK